MEETNNLGKSVPKKSNLNKEMNIIAMKGVESFLKISNDLENVLTEIEVDEIIKPTIILKLKHIQSAIEKKILVLSFEDEVKKKENEAKTKSDSDTEKSLPLINKTKTQTYKKFLKNIDCPFCLKSQSDKFELINHINKDCVTCQTKSFEKETIVPYTVFQILPNNTFKCNFCSNAIFKTIKKYFFHKTHPNHKQKCLQALPHKKYSESLFCSCCKILVPDNYLEIDFHLNHAVHLENSYKNNKNISQLLQEKISIAYLNKKIFKCLLCSPTVEFKSAKMVLQHVNEKTHLEAAFKKSVLEKILYCELCDEEFDVRETSHFSSDSHMMKEFCESEKKTNFKICFYCGLKCESQELLYKHMIKNCVEIAELKENPQTKNSKEIEPEIKFTGKNFIVFEGPLKMSKIDLGKRYMKFGTITSLEPCSDGSVMLVFAHESSVKAVMNQNTKSQIKLKKTKRLELACKIEKVDYEEFQFDDEFGEGDSSDDEFNLINF